MIRARNGIRSTSPKVVVPLVLSDEQLDWLLAFDPNGAPHFRRRTVKGGSILFPEGFLFSDFIPQNHVTGWNNPTNNQPVHVLYVYFWTHGLNSHPHESR